MRKNSFSKRKYFKLKKIVVVFLIICNGILLFPIRSSVSSDIEQNNYLHVINQAINSLLESSANKTDNNILQESGSSYFYSYDYCLKKLNYYPKIFTIISETNSEQNIRYSTFLLTQAQTST